MQKTEQRFILSQVVVEMFHALSQLVQVFPLHPSRMEACPHKCSHRFHSLFWSRNKKYERLRMNKDKYVVQKILIIGLLDVMSL